MERIIDLHHDIFFYLIILSVFVLWFLIRINFLFKSEVSIKPVKASKITHNTILEIVWTIIPCILLLIIAIPSLSLIYSFQPLNKSNLIFKVIGNQWWWGYEYTSLKNNAKLDAVLCWWLFDLEGKKHIANQTRAFKMAVIKEWEGDFTYWDTSMGDEYEFWSHIHRGQEPYTYWEWVSSIESKFIESRLIDDLDLDKGDFRLLEVSNKVQMPRNLQINVLVTSNDVLHSWAVPSLGVKIDACPGRLNEIEFLIYKEGLFFGQCSEICGFFHGFMPIIVDCQNISDIIKKTENLKVNFGMWNDWSIPLSRLTYDKKN
jgi:heme/copper-type cytochrome/quinol oxidase subunit 2